MIATIKKGKHSQFEIPKFLFKPKSFHLEVRFTDSCKYDLKSKDQHDINKLFGVSFLSLGSFVFVLKSVFQAIRHLSLSKIKSLHHYNSARWGWRYNLEKEKIELFDYSYTKGVNTQIHKFDVDINQVVMLSLKDSSMMQGLITEIPLPKKINVCYELYHFFGGQEKAPHDINIEFLQLLQS